MSILEIFLGTNCKVCGHSKPKNTAFCKRCYFSLPRSLRDALWHRFGEGFEGAYSHALAWLEHHRMTEGNVK